MSRNKFAAITSSLLARKGEAAPWPNAAPAWAPAFVPDAPPVIAPEPRFVAPEPRFVMSEAPIVAAKTKAPPPNPEAVKRCTVRLTQREYERLGILAVKTGVTRQQLLKQALSEFLAARAAQYGCACLGACNNNCGQAG